MNQTLFLMMGLPGAGKTTTASIIEQLTGAIRLTSDEARFMLFDSPEFTEREHEELYNYLNDQTEHMLSAKKSVIYDANLNRYIHRQEKYQLAQKYNVDVVLCWVQTPKYVAKKRATDNSRAKLWKKSETPDAMFERVAATIEPPEKTENVIILDGTKLSKSYVQQKLGL